MVAELSFGKTSGWAFISLKNGATVIECSNSDTNDWDLDFRKHIMDREFDSWIGLV